MKNLADKMREMLCEQAGSWELLRRNREDLARAQTRRFSFDRFRIDAAFNPTRAASSLARTDENSIRGRRCFLCRSNRPAEQAGIRFDDRFEILCNPFPIFPEHFTIIHDDHRPQQILDSFPTMLKLARDIATRYTVFYNGPQCGASAPDHLHLQAGTRGFMPLDEEYDRIKSFVAERDTVACFTSTGYIRPFISLESSDPAALDAAFRRIYTAFQRLTHRRDEPMLNLIARFDKGVWRAILFPRVKHRPSFYFADDHSRMLLSPGTVDVGGVITLVREEDFQRLSKEHLTRMFHEISASPETVAKLLHAFG